MGIPPPTGASVNISCEFVRPAGKEGEELFSVGEVVKLGQSNLYQAQWATGDRQGGLRRSPKSHSTIKQTR